MFAVFPAPAGMNREGIAGADKGSGVPRASGDEPGVEVRGNRVRVCSPRQRG